MAVMMPENCETFKSDGEGRFYGFLKTVTRSNAAVLVWYLPDIKGVEPDFILYHNEVGLVIFEVKDWLLVQIREATPQTFKIDNGGRVESRKNPLLQAHDYLASIMDKIKDDGRLISKEPVHHGNPKIPINWGVVFPNINKYEYEGKGLDQVIPVDKIFFGDDLHPFSDICNDPTGKCFVATLERMFPPRFRWSISPKELHVLKQLLFPIVKIELPRPAAECAYEREHERLRGLDHQQEAIARKLDGGHRLIVGPAGSGKTLVLVHKAAFYQHYYPAVKRILFVCYNITLVNYIKRLLLAKQVQMGENGVEVYHFFELCARILGQEVAYENEDWDYYQFIVQETLGKMQAAPLQYDAILVDEGQDFSDEMYRVLMGLLNKKTNLLTIALDENQTIYKRQQAWKEQGIQIQGRVHKLSYVYRNTKELTQFAEQVRLGCSEDEAPPAQPQLGLFSDIFNYHGPKPEIRQFSALDSVLDYLVATIKTLAEIEKYPFSEMAIAYIIKSPEDASNIHLPHLIQERLGAQGIFTTWAAEDYRAKRTYDITTNSVTISTIHSLKGLDYACVFLVGLDFIPPDRWTEAQLKSLVYVGITRARYRLFVPYYAPNPIIQALLKIE